MGFRVSLFYKESIVFDFFIKDLEFYGNDGGETDSELLILRWGIYFKII